MKIRPWVVFLPLALLAVSANAGERQRLPGKRTEAVWSAQPAPLAPAAAKRPKSTASSGIVTFSSIPVPMPGSFPSLGYQATSTDEFGEHVALGGLARGLVSATVSMTDWACENDGTRLSNEACVSTPGSSFVHPITLNLYEVDNTGPDPAVGPVIATVTQMVAVPFRPSWDPVCPDPTMDVPFGGTWFDPVLGACVHGYNFLVTFDLSTLAIVLPDEVILSIAYDTQSYGSAPIGVNGPYNSLNVSVTTDPPTVGSDVEPGTVFWDTSFAGFYCDGGAGGVGTFRRDADCWTTTGLPGDPPYTMVFALNTM